MELVSAGSLAVIFVIWIRSFARKGGGLYLLLIPVVILAVILGYTTYQQFLIWKSHEISRFLLPPHAPINYFIFYTFTRIWLAYVISLIVGILGYLVIGYFNRKYQEKFFWPEEIYFIALGLFLTGHPGWILYTVFSLAVYLALGIGYWILKKETQRVSFYYLWLPLAAATIFLNFWLLQFEWYTQLII